MFFIPAMIAMAAAAGAVATQAAAAADADKKRKGRFATAKGEVDEVYDPMFEKASRTTSDNAMNSMFTMANSGSGTMGNNASMTRAAQMQAPSVMGMANQQAHGIADQYTGKVMQNQGIQLAEDNSDQVAIWGNAKGAFDTAGSAAGGYMGGGMMGGTGAMGAGGGAGAITSDERTKQIDPERYYREHPNAPSTNPSNEDYYRTAMGQAAPTAGTFEQQRDQRQMAQARAGTEMTRRGETAMAQTPYDVQMKKQYYANPQRDENPARSSGGFDSEDGGYQNLVRTMGNGIVTSDARTKRLDPERYYREHPNAAAIEAEFARGGRQEGDLDGYPALAAEQRQIQAEYSAETRGTRQGPDRQPGVDFNTYYGGAFSNDDSAGKAGQRDLIDGVGHGWRESKMGDVEYETQSMIDQHFQDKADAIARKRGGGGIVTSDARTKRIDPERYYREHPNATPELNNKDDQRAYQRVNPDRPPGPDFNTYYGGAFSDDDSAGKTGQGKLVPGTGHAWRESRMGDGEYETQGMIDQHFQDKADAIARKRGGPQPSQEPQNVMDWASEATSGQHSRLEGRDMIRKAPGKSYEYKPEFQGRPGTAPGPQYGPMAQDLEKSRLGKQAVSTGPDGMKQVDPARIAMSSVGAMHDLEARLRKLEGGRGR